MARPFKYPVIEKNCPVCGNIFNAQGRSKKHKTTCSHACANTFFRSGINHPNWRESSYRTTCFHYHKHECVVCKENKLVEVHHLDENNQNNSPSNLVPLCPTHHQYWHSRHKADVELIIYNYVKAFLESINESKTKETN
jgi:hypothetical protein